MKFLLAVLFLITALAETSDAQSEPPFGMGELEAYSVFLDGYRSGDYELAINFGEWMLEAKPTEIEGHENFSLERQFDRMIDTYLMAAEGESDPSQTTAYLEKAEKAFETLYETFDESEIDLYDWYLKQGRFYHENNEQMSATIDDAFKKYKKLYEMDHQRFAEEGDGFFAMVLLNETANSGERDEAMEMIDNLEEFASMELLDAIAEIRESLFENPEERIEFIESRFAAAGEAEREEMLGDLVQLYDEINDSEKAAESAIQLYEMNPNYQNTRYVADMLLSDGNYSEAIDYLIESKELAENDTDRKEIALQIAESYQQTDQFEEARDYVQRALAIDETYGEAYLRMSAIYARTISNCTGGDVLAREDRTVYWLVVDYLEKAAEHDPSLASTANNRAESYTDAMPSAEDKFFNDWEDGDSFTIDGELSPCYAWINETTTVR
ncbi:MAG: tetratricopeptide repeat protein [Balneolaceae bacterium]|nr:tetratricopeptide repeat protein [Balneolaceae bacterium]